MNLKKKKVLAASVLGVGKGRIRFNKERLSDIKASLSKQDIRDLFNDKAITIKEKKGRLLKPSRNTRRRAGSIKKNPSNKKMEHIIITRKLRKYLAELRKRNQISRENYYFLRKEIRSKAIKDKAHLKSRVQPILMRGGEK